MKSVYCLNPISNAGMSRFDDTYCIADSIENADAVLLRSASMHEMTMPYEGVVALVDFMKKFEEENL